MARAILIAILASFLLSVPAKSWVHNESGVVVYVKPEKSEKPIKLVPGAKHHGEQDGFAVPLGRMGEVYKTCNRCNVVVGPGVSIKRLSCQGALENACQATEGGWRSKSYVKKHKDWKQLYCAGWEAACDLK